MHRFGLREPDRAATGLLTNIVNFRARLTIFVSAGMRLTIFVSGKGRTAFSGLAEPLNNHNLTACAVNVYYL